LFAGTRAAPDPATLGKQQQTLGLFGNPGVYLDGCTRVVLFDEIEDCIAILQSPGRPLQLHTSPPSGSLRWALARRLAK